MNKVEEESQKHSAIEQSGPLLTQLTVDEKLQYLIELLQSGYVDQRVLAAIKVIMRRHSFLSTLAWNLFAVSVGWLLSVLINIPSLIRN